MTYMHNKKRDKAKIKSLENLNNMRQEKKIKIVKFRKIITTIVLISIIVAIFLSVYFLYNFKSEDQDYSKDINHQNYYVSIKGKGNYSSIQSAINSALDNDTIFVSNGNYFENINITKSLELIGEDKNTTIINGNGLGTTIYISADYVKIKGFTITNAGLTSQNSNIRDAAGIKIESSYNVIFNCNISSNLNYGIYLYANPDNMNNLIYFNTFYNNRIGICAGNTILTNISSNIFIGNTNYGIYLEDKSNDNFISDNILTENIHGIRIKGSEKNTIIKNFIMNNGYGLYFCCGAKNNLAYNNVFINNTDWNANETLPNIWDNGIIGNFWDDYTGTDEDGDGIGDVPYIINLEDQNKDRFPIMTQQTIII